MHIFTQLMLLTELWKHWLKETFSIGVEVNKEK